MVGGVAGAVVGGVTQQSSVESKEAPGTVERWQLLFPQTNPLAQSESLSQSPSPSPQGFDGEQQSSPPMHLPKNNIFVTLHHSKVQALLFDTRGPDRVFAPEKKTAFILMKDINFKVLLKTLQNCIDGRNNLAGKMTFSRPELNSFKLHVVDHFSQKLTKRFLAPSSHLLQIPQPFMA